MLTVIIGTTVWITVLLFRIHFDNQAEHAKLMLGLSELNARSANWLTMEQYEEATMWMAQQLHGRGTNFTYRREQELRAGLRKKLKTPKEP